MPYDPNMHRITDAIDMVGRMGAQSFQLGYLVDDPPPDAANWYAEAEFRSGTLVTMPCMTPWEAAEELASTLQRNATCRWCARTIAWGNRPPAKKRLRFCWWRQVAGRWERGCPSRDVPAVPDSERL